MTTLVITIKDSDAKRLQRVATRLGITTLAVAKESVIASLGILDAETVFADRAEAKPPSYPPTAAAMVTSGFETMWRPHRDAPSLISDIAPGVSAYPSSSLAGSAVGRAAGRTPR